MYMTDWTARLDDFLRMAGSDILENAGSVSHEQALKKAASEYEKYKERHKNELSEVERDFIKQIDNVSKQLTSKKRRNAK